MMASEDDGAELIALLNSISESNQIYYDNEGQPIDEFLYVLNQNALHSKRSERSTIHEREVETALQPPALKNDLANIHETNAFEYDILLGLNNNYDYIGGKPDTRKITEVNIGTESRPVDDESLSINSNNSDDTDNYDLVPQITQKQRNQKDDLPIEKTVKLKPRNDISVKVKADGKRPKTSKKKALVVENIPTNKSNSKHENNHTSDVVEMASNHNNPTSGIQNPEDPLLIKLKSYQLRHKGLVNTIRELEVKVSNLLNDNDKKDSDIRQLQYKVNVLANASETHIPKKIANVTNTNLVATNQLLHQQANQLKVHN